MPRMQVYLPDHLYRAVKEMGLEASRLLQTAVRVEVTRRRLLQETDRFLAELVAEVGEPDDQEVARAQAIARSLARRTQRAAG